MIPQQSLLHNVVRHFIGSSRHYWVKGVVTKGAFMNYRLARVLGISLFLTSFSVPLQVFAADLQYSEESTTAVLIPQLDEESLANLILADSATHKATCKCKCGDHDVTFDPTGGLLCDQMNGQECVAGDPPKDNVLSSCKWSIVPIPVNTTNAF